MTARCPPLSLEPPRDRRDVSGLPSCRKYSIMVFILLITRPDPGDVGVDARPAS